MRVIIEEIGEHEEDQIIIRCKKLTSKHYKAIDMLQAQDFVIAYKSNSIYKIDADDILYWEAVDKKVFLYTANEVYDVKQTLGELREQLSDDFLRISRVAVLNWRKLDSLKPLLNGRLEATLENGEKLIISRQYVNKLKRKFTENQQ